MKLLDDSDLENELRILVQAAGNASRFSRDFGYPHKNVVSDVLSGRAAIPASLARILGYESILPLRDGMPRTPAHRPMRWKRINRDAERRE